MRPAGKVNMSNELDDFKKWFKRAEKASFAAYDGSPPSFVYSEQGALWGERQAVGFGNDAFRVREIEKAKANAVSKNHSEKPQR